MVRRCNRVRRTGINAAGARAAASDLRGIGWQRNRSKDFPDEKPSPELSIKQHCALTVPTNSRFGGKVPFEHRPRVDVDFLAATGGGEQSVQFLQPPLHDIVIIVPPSVARDPSSRSEAHTSE